MAWDLLTKELPAAFNGGCLTLIHEDKIGWLATYMYFGRDVMDSLYYPTAEEAIKTLHERVFDK